MAALIAAETTSPSVVLNVVLALASALGVGGIVALVTLRSTARAKSAGADKAEADVDRAEVEIEDLRQRLTRDVLKDVEGQLSQYRERIHEERTRAAAATQGQAEAQAAQAQAQAELAKAQVLLAETLEQSSKERHSLRNEVAALGVQNANLRAEIDKMKTSHAAEVAELRGEIASLRAQQDASHHGRRRGDGEL